MRDSPNPTSGLAQPDIPDYLQCARHYAEYFVRHLVTYRKHCPHSSTPGEVAMVTLTSQTLRRFSHLPAEMEDLNTGHLLAEIAHLTTELDLTLSNYRMKHCLSCSYTHTLPPPTQSGLSSFDLIALIPRITNRSATAGLLAMADHSPECSQHCGGRPPLETGHAVFRPLRVSRPSPHSLSSRIAGHV